MQPGSGALNDAYEHRRKMGARLLVSSWRSVAGATNQPHLKVSKYYVTYHFSAHLKVRSLM